jgi:cell division ATPase FtsA
MTGVSGKLRKTQPKELIFALDIGTRSIVGIVGAAEGERLRVIAMEKAEHTQRAMVDGQIEDIEQVARLPGPLKTVWRKECAAGSAGLLCAAGRALKTQRASYDGNFSRSGWMRIIAVWKRGHRRS